MKKIKKIIISLSIIAVFLLVFFSYPLKGNQEQIYGVSFNSDYAGYLGLDSLDVFDKIIDDWDFKHIRLSAQWNKIEIRPNEYNFSELDELMNRASEKGAKVILAIGQKTPRWPECYAPDWTKEMDDFSYKAEVYKMILNVVLRYKDHPALEIWQVENEPFLKFFGNCRILDKDFLQTEIDLVRFNDPVHPILITDSGELSSWKKTATMGDFFGTTLYRVVWNKYFNYFSYDFIPASFYQIKLWLNEKKLSQAFVAELQAEPWIPNADINKLTLEEQFKSMNLKRLQKNITFSQRVGFSRAYLWGAEWWYFLEAKYSIKDFSDFMQTLKKE